MEQIPQPVQDLAKKVLISDYTIEDWDIDRIYIKKGDHDYTIRMWNITDDDIRWTLFIDVPDKDGGSHGEEMDFGIFEYTVKETKGMMMWVVAGWDEETLERDDDWVQGLFEPASLEDLATIDTLKNDVKQQLQELKDDIHPDGCLMAWGSKNEVLVLREGAFVWDEESASYVDVRIHNVYKETYFNDNFIEGHKYNDRFTAEFSR